MPSPDPTDESEPTPADDVRPWPDAARLTEAPTCGAPLPAMVDPDPDGAHEVYFFTYVTGWPAVEGEPLALQTSVAIGLEGGELHGQPLAVPQLVVLRDDVVVGMVDLPTELPATLTALISTGGGPVTEAEPVLTACDGSGPLPAGDYRMFVWQPFAPVAGFSGGPEDLLLAADAEGLRIEPAGTPRLPGCGHPFDPEPIDDARWLVEGEVVVGRESPDGFTPDPTGDRISAFFTSGPDGEPYAMSGWPEGRAYLVDTDGTIAFWDDPALMVDEAPSGRLWEPLDCRTGERLAGTYRAFRYETRWPWPGMPAEPPREVVRLPDVTVAPAAGG